MTQPTPSSEENGKANASENPSTASQNQPPRIQRTVPFKNGPQSRDAVPMSPSEPKSAPPANVASKAAPQPPSEEKSAAPPSSVRDVQPSKTKDAKTVVKKSPDAQNKLAQSPAPPTITRTSTTPVNKNPPVQALASEDSSPTPSKPSSQKKTDMPIPHKNSRPESWEDDIAFNTLDDKAFSANPSPSSTEFSVEKLAHRIEQLKPLMNGKDIAEFMNNDTYPIPVPEDREGYFPGNDAAYWLNGLEDCLKVLDVASRHNVEPKSILDFGCASGRVLRHFVAQTDIADIWGTDINQRHVRWLYEHLPNRVRPVFNHCIPTLPLRDNSVDIITAFSVFTHIDTFETHWLAELARIMSDDGICYLTVHNEDTWERLRLEMDNQQNRLIQSILKVDPNFSSDIKTSMPAGRRVYRFTQSGPYRAQVFHSDCYLRNVWGRFFKVEAIMPCHHVRQSVVVLRKKQP